jgi:hypothetical protein
MLHPSCHDEVMMEGEQRGGAHEKHHTSKAGPSLDRDELIIASLIDAVGQLLEVQDEEELERLIERDFKRAVRLRQNESSLKVVI